MSQLSMDEILHDVPRFLQRIEAGEQIVITRSGKVVAEVKPISAAKGGPRPFGLCVEHFTVPDDFDLPLPEETLREFEGA